MALTQVQRPPDLAMKRSNMTFVYTSSNSGETGFKYIVEVKHGSTTLGKYYISKNPSDRLVFDLRSVTEDFVQLDVTDEDDFTTSVFEMPHNTDKLFSKAQTGIRKIDIEFGEVYGDPLTEYTALDTETIHLLDGITPYKLGLNYEWSELQPDSATKKGWLTDRTQTADNPSGQTAIVVKANDNDFGVMCFLNDSTGIISSGVLQLSYRIYDEVGQQGSDSLTIGPTYGIGLPSSTDERDKLAYMGFLPGNLNKSDNPLNFAPNTITDWTYYTLELLDGTINRQAIRLVVVNTSDPCKHNPAMVHWRNSVGGWDFFKFEGRVDRELMQKGKTYQKPIYDEANNNFNAWDREQTQFYTDNELTLTLRTGIISIAERDLIQNILKSDQILIYYDGDWYPVVPDTKTLNSYEKISRAQQVTMKFKVAQTEL